VASFNKIINVYNSNIATIGIHNKIMLFPIEITIKTIEDFTFFYFQQVDLPNFKLYLSIMKQTKYFLIAFVILFVLWFAGVILHEQYEYYCGCPDKPGGYSWSHPCYEGGE
jgi:hypothetical protein